MPALRTRTTVEETAVVTSDTYRLLVILVAILTFALGLVGLLFLFNRIKEKRKAASSTMGHRRSQALTISTSPHIYSEKQRLMECSSPMPLSPENVPEIRITFPEEEDRSGRRVSGTVVLVQVGDGSIGYKPVEDDGLPPAYQQVVGTNGPRFASVDLDRVGGLREKELNRF